MFSKSSNGIPVGYRLRDWIVTVIAAALILWASQPWNVLEFKHVALLGFNLFFVFILLWWTDQYEREPFFSLLWAVTWGAFPACLFAIFLESTNSSLMGSVFIEEFLKLIGLVVVFRRGSIESWTDGLVIGGFIGLGFAAFEDILYAINGGDVFETLIYRGIFSIFAHTFFSGIGATFIVIGLLSKRIWIALIGFAVAFTLHLMWNTILAIQILDSNFVLFSVFFSFLPPVVLFSTSLIVRRRERLTLRFRGAHAISMGVISPDQLEMIASLKYRRKFLKSIGSKYERANARQDIELLTRNVLKQ
jgi:RsiW-degrading membrane proteinase PrsW (M82 family)